MKRSKSRRKGIPRRIPPAESLAFSAESTTTATQVSKQGVGAKKPKVDETTPVRWESSTNEEERLIGELLFSGSIDRSPDSPCFASLAQNSDSEPELRIFDNSRGVSTLPGISFDNFDEGSVVSAVCWLFAAGCCRLTWKGDEKRNLIFVRVWLTEKALKENVDSSDCSGRVKKVDQLIHDLIWHFVSPDLSSADPGYLEAPKDINGLYTAVQKAQGRGEMSATGIQTDDDSFVPIELLPTLRSYQKAALKWMLARETEQEAMTQPHPLWTEIKLTGGSTLHYNLFSHRVSSRKFSEPPLPKGGILADEMGLGKTVETLALILAHPMLPCEPVSHCQSSPRQNGGNFAMNCVCGAWGQTVDTESDSVIQCVMCLSWFHLACVKWALYKAEPLTCPTCWKKKDPVVSGATLVVSPASIALQWEQELEKHVQPGRLRHLVYNGTKKDGYVHPLEIAQYDVVLTTYETLTKELAYASLSYDSHRTRQCKKHIFPSSPLPFILWWRVCLDEAQMVEHPSKKDSEMISRLPAVHRWCVTGTPIEKGPGDIYGLLSFLKIEPYCRKSSWLRLLYDPYVREKNGRRMVDLLSRIFWRTRKTDVFDELGIPPLDESEQQLSFSSVEAFYYQKKQQECSSKADQLISRCVERDVSLSSLRRDTVQKMLHPLLLLRRVCCHPYEAKGRGPPILKTIDEVLVQMTTKTKVEYAEGHREVICALNGLAAIHAIHGDIGRAVEVYRKAIASWKEHNPNVETDRLQKIHTLHNLAELLDLGDSSCGRTLNDEFIKKETQDLIGEYTAKMNEKVASSVSTWESQLDNLNKLREELDHKNPWWINVISVFEGEGKEDTVMRNIKLMLAETQIGGGAHSSANRMENLSGLSYVVHNGVEKIKTCRDDVVDRLTELIRRELSEGDVQLAAACHLRPEPSQPRNRSRCRFCCAEEAVNALEAVLFSKTIGQGSARPFDEELYPEEINDPSSRDEDQGRQTRADSEMEKILKSLASMARGCGVEETFLNQAKIHFQYFEALKKEFKILKPLWMDLTHQVAAADELAMAKTRLRLREPDEPVVIPRNLAILEREEIFLNKIKLEGDLALGQRKLRASVGQLRYLETLAANHKHIGESNHSPCPVCRALLGTEWAVMSCGHSVCFSCCSVLISRTSIDMMKCPLCRLSTRKDALTYVSAVDRKQATSEKIHVKGSHSTKVTAVLLCLAKIQMEDDKAKILVFSTWHIVLTILASALAQNNIPHGFISDKKSFQSKLTEFKQSQTVNVLLLPLHSGSKGLNIVEANHVILVEPALNVANELQAIGRVHRIGQERPTFVHRFYIKDTVEDRIRLLFSDRRSANTCVAAKEERALTVAELAALFEN